MTPSPGWLALIVLSASVSPELADATCAAVELGPVPFTRAGAHVPADGGILVGIGASRENKPTDADASQVAYKATADGGKTVSLVMASLAPGLTVYRPRPALVGPLTIRASKSSLAVTFDKAKGAPLPTPAVTAVTTSTQAEPYGQRVDLVAAVASVPDAAAALIVYRMKDEEHVPISFGTPAHDKVGPTTVLVYSAGGHCANPVPPGTLAAAVGEEVSLAWVDAYGRLSAVSAPVTVR